MCGRGRRPLPPRPFRPAWPRGSRGPGLRHPLRPAALPELSGQRGRPLPLPCLTVPRPRGAPPARQRRSPPGRRRPGRTWPCRLPVRRQEARVLQRWAQVPGPERCRLPHRVVWPTAVRSGQPVPRRRAKPPFDLPPAEWPQPKPAPREWWLQDQERQRHPEPSRRQAAAPEQQAPQKLVLALKRPLRRQRRLLLPVQRSEPAWRQGQAHRWDCLDPARPQPACLRPEPLRPRPEPERGFREPEGRLPPRPARWQRDRLQWNRWHPRGRGCLPARPGPRRPRQCRTRQRRGRAAPLRRRTVPGRQGQPGLVTLCLSWPSTSAGGDSFSTIPVTGSLPAKGQTAENPND